MQRIVSLLPSLTEIVCEIGLGPALVGRSHECDFPEDLGEVPVLTEAKLDAEAPSGAIDARVRELVERGLSVYRVDPERLREVAPDVILTQDHCEVCAASLADVEAALAEWTGAAPRVVSVAPKRLTEVLSSFGRIGRELGETDAGFALSARVLGGMEEIAARTHAIPNPPKVACIEWLDPLMGAGNWMPELIGMAGGEPLFGDAGEHSPWIDAVTLAEADPDVLLLVPCGFDVARTRAELEGLPGREELLGLRAVAAGRAFVADGNAYFNRSGPRLLDSLEILAEILHPSRFPARHEGSGWQRL